MMISTTTQTRKKNKIKLWTIAFWLLLWQFASMALDKQILLASPLSVGRCLLSLVRTFSFWESIWFSLERIALGFFCAAAGGVLLSALAYHVKLIRDILALPVAVLKATPVASFIVHLDAVREPVNTDFSHYGISDHLYKSSGGI